MTVSPYQICNYRWITWSGIRDAFALHGFQMDTELLGRTLLHTKISTFEDAREFVALCYQMSRPSGAQIITFSVTDLPLQMLLPLIPIREIYQLKGGHKRYPYVHLFLYHPDFTLAHFCKGLDRRCVLQGPSLAHQWPRCMLLNIQYVNTMCQNTKTLRKVSDYIKRNKFNSAIAPLRIECPAKIEDIFRRVMRAWKQQREDEREDISTRAMIRRKGRPLRRARGEVFIFWAQMLREFPYRGPRGLQNIIQRHPVLRSWLVRYALFDTLKVAMLTWRELDHYPSLVVTLSEYNMSYPPWLRDHLLDVHIDTSRLSENGMAVLEISTMAHQILRENKATGKMGEFWPQFFDRIGAFGRIIKCFFIPPSTNEDPWLHINHTDPWIEDYQACLAMPVVVPYLDRILLDRFHDTIDLADGYFPRAKLEVGARQLRNADCETVLKYFDYSMPAWLRYGANKRLISKNFVLHTKAPLRELQQHDVPKEYLHLHYEATEEIIANYPNNGSEKTDIITELVKQHGYTLLYTKKYIMNMIFNADYYDKTSELLPRHSMIISRETILKKREFMKFLLRIVADEFVLILENNLDSDRVTHSRAEVKALIHE